jgi:hypothetical protein
MMKKMVMGAVVVLAMTLAVMANAHAQLTADPTAGGVLVFKNGTTETVGEIVAEAAYAFQTDDAGNQWGQLCTLFGISSPGTKMGGLGYRQFMRAGEVYFGLGASGFVFEKEIVPQIDETSVALAPELLIEIPWLSDSGQTRSLTAYVSYYFPVSGDTDFNVARFGVKANL